MTCLGVICNGILSRIRLLDWNSNFTFRPLGKNLDKNQDMISRFWKSKCWIEQIVWNLNLQPGDTTGHVIPAPCVFVEMCFRFIIQFRRRIAHMPALAWSEFDGSLMESLRGFQNPCMKIDLNGGWAIEVLFRPVNIHATKSGRLFVFVGAARFRILAIPGKPSAELSSPLMTAQGAPPRGWMPTGFGTGATSVHPGLGVNDVMAMFVPQLSTWKSVGPKLVTQVLLQMTHSFSFWSAWAKVVELNMNAARMADVSICFIVIDELLSARGIICVARRGGILPR